MHFSASVWALCASASSTLAIAQGFNFASTSSDGAVKVQADYEAEFQASKALLGTNGDFASARLYSMAQGSSNAPNEALAAAVKTGFSVLLGLWASGGDAAFAVELSALKTAIQTYAGTSLKIVGVSVGSEDLYRLSPIGIQNHELPGAQPDTIAGYIQQVRAALQGTAFASVPVGHVDTWTVWVNGSNQAVINACDFIGMDAYPYFQATQANAIGNDISLFSQALAVTQAAAGGKPVWVTETGWPVSGKTVGQGVPSLSNAQQYWRDVGCDILFGKIPTWWFTLRDADPTTPNPSFSVLNSALAEPPLYNLSCPAAGPSTTTTSTSTTASLPPPSSSSTPASAGPSSFTTSTQSSALTQSSAPTTAPTTASGPSAASTPGSSASPSGPSSQSVPASSGPSAASSLASTDTVLGPSPVSTPQSGSASVNIISSTLYSGTAVQPPPTMSSLTVPPTQTAAAGRLGAAGAAIAAAGVAVLAF